MIVLHVLLVLIRIMVADRAERPQEVYERQRRKCISDNECQILGRHKAEAYRLLKLA